MKGWLIFKHSFLMVFRNWREALKIGFVPVLMVIVIAGLSLRSVAVDIAQGMTPEEFEVTVMETGTLVGFLLTWIAGMTAMLWIVVNWHRFVLLEEYPTSWLSPFYGGPVLGYLGRLLLLGLIAAIVMIPLGVVTGIVSTSPALGMIALLVSYFVIAILLYRVIAILPAAAIGKPIKIGEAFAATKGANWDIFFLMLISFAVNFLFQQILAVVADINPFIGLIFWIPVTWAFALVNVSVLTTFYGHYIEGRPID